MFRILIQSKVSQDEKNGIYVAPSLPAVKLGKILMNERRIAQPGDVILLHLDEGFFGQTIIILTDTRCYYDKGSFALADVKSATASGRSMKITFNQAGSLVDSELKAGNEVAARTICQVLEACGRQQEKTETEVVDALPSIPDLSKNEIDWLRLRDEVMKTIDILYQKFNDGKISLLEYEEKKSDLLSRL